MGLPKLLFDNRFADAVPVASTTAAGNYAAANIADLRPYTWWKPTALPATLTVDCGSAKAADYALVYGHDLGSKGGSIAIEGSTDNFVNSIDRMVLTQPANDDPFLMEYASGAYKYWRAKIWGGHNLFINSEEIAYDALEAAGDVLNRDTGIGMSGGATADNFVVGTTSAIHRIRPIPLIQMNSGSVYSHSWYLRPTGITNGKILGWTGTSKLTMNFDLSGAGSVGAPVVTGGMVLLGYGIQLLEDGIYKIWISITCGFTAGYQLMLYAHSPAGAETWVGDGVSGIELCGIQFENSPNPSTYIPTAGAAVTNAPSIAMVLIGAAFEMPKYLGSGFDPVGRAAVQQSNSNENGHPLGKLVQFEKQKKQLRFANVTWSWLRNPWQPAWDSHLRSSPFIFAWDSVNYPAELQLVTSGDSYQGPHKPGSIADLSFEVSGVAR